MPGQPKGPLPPFFATLGSLVAGVFLLNTRVDLAGLDSGRRVAELARRQAPSQVLVSERDYDQRAWVKARLEKGCPEVLLLGSSTVGMLASSMFSNPSFLNGWLTGPSVEDFAALASILQQDGCVPRRILIGIDPFLLNPLVTDQRWLSLREDRARFRAGSSRLQSFVLEWQTFKERLGFS